MKVKGHGFEGPDEAIISSGYTLSTKVLFAVISPLGTGLLVAAFVMHSDSVDWFTLLLGTTLVIVWGCALYDALCRRVWLFNDRIMLRNPFAATSTIHYRDVVEMKEGMTE